MNDWHASSNEVQTWYTFIPMKYPKYPSLTILIKANTSDSNSSSISEANNSPDENEKTSITWDSDYTDDDKSINSSIGSEEKIDSTVAEMHLSSIN